MTNYLAALVWVGGVFQDVSLDWGGISPAFRPFYLGKYLVSLIH